ncbi:uncharacterized protein LOC141596999 [Silene latifolia]|uniref:uncharacterized protein LOC141596999 n=1 Tax=Silene latifolia TaxID=37657 RepID=UPI003D7869F1
MHGLQGHCGSVYKVTDGSGSHSGKNCNCSARTFSLDMCKQSNGALQGLGPSRELCLKASQTHYPQQLIQLSSFSAKLDHDDMLDSCEKKVYSLETSLVGCQSNVVGMKPLNPWAREYHRAGDQRFSLVKSKDNVTSGGMKPLNPWAREYHRAGDQHLSFKQESMHSFVESLRKQELSSTLNVNEPISFANISGNSNLLNILNYFPQKAPVVCSRKKLLILDINGILADIVYPPPKGYKADTKIAGRAVFTRPFCSDFLNFCLERFNVAIWSSRSRKIIDRLLNYLMGDMKDKLIFCWDLSHCTASNFRTLENKHKTLVFKELRKVWESYDSDLPWEKGFFNESNTFLLDDTPYKALLNPAHTGIFPYSYEFKNIADNAIGPGGNIRAYLEEIAEADNVQRYIEKHPFGQSAITERSLSWQFYDKVIKDQGAVPVSAGG